MQFLSPEGEKHQADIGSLVQIRKLTHIEVAVAGVIDVAPDNL